MEGGVGERPQAGTSTEQGLIYFSIGRKYSELVLDGYDHSTEKSYTDSTSCWVCPSYFKTKCKARVITKGNMVYVEMEIIICQSIDYCWICLQNLLQ